MFAKTTNVGFAQRVVATLVASAVLLWSFGSYISTAQAAQLSEVSNILSTSNPGVTASHFIEFKLASSLAIGDTIRITFPTDTNEFDNVDALVAGNIDVIVDGVDAAETAFDSPAGGATSYFEFDSGVTGAAGDTVTVAIANGVIINPAATTSHEIEVRVTDGSYTDTGKTRVAIVDSILVTAIVETTFDFVIEGVATGTGMSVASTITATTSGESSPTALSYGVLEHNIAETLGQRLNVTTNAREGFVVTVETDGDFQSANGAIIDVFQDSSDEDDTGVAWVPPLADIDDETTWGHWGLISDDSDLVSNGSFYSEEFGVSESFIAASTTPRVVFHHDGPANGSTQDKGEALVFYRVEISPFQEAADDYNTTLTYIATPTF